MKVIIKKVILIILLLTIFAPYSLADDEDNEILDYVWLDETMQTAQIKETPNVLSKVAVAYDRKSKTVIYGKNENEKVPMASTTKIMTAIVMIENVKDLEQEVEVCKQAASIGGSRLGLKTGDQITYNNLLYGLMLCSGNDAAIQIAVSIAGSVEQFAELMNAKAIQLGLKNTHFVTPHGLDKYEHYTTAYELAVIADYALNIQKFSDVVSTKTYTVTINGHSKTLTNTNELLGYLQGVNGVKTGFTNGAGRCLVSSVYRDNFNIIVVVLGADTKKIRTKDSINIIEYIYSNYKMVNIEEKIEQEFQNWTKINKKRIFINKGIKENIKIDLQQYKYKSYPILKKDIEKLKIETVNTKTYLEAPILKDTAVGTIKVSIGDKNELMSIRIKVVEDIGKKGVKEYFLQCLLQTKIIYKK